MKCPKCGVECEADSVDIGVGLQEGPPYCPECGWGPSELALADIDGSDDDDDEDDDLDDDDLDDDEDDDIEDEDEGDLTF